MYIFSNIKYISFRIYVILILIFLYELQYPAWIFISSIKDLFKKYEDIPMPISS